MLNIPGSMFLSFGIAAIPSLLAVYIAIRIKNKKKMTYSHSIKNSHMHEFSLEMQQRLFEQQIDSIFQSLNTIIDGECTKLKMITRSWSTIVSEHKKFQKIDPFLEKNTIKVQMNKIEPINEVADNFVESRDRLGIQIAECMENKMTAQDIAKKLNMSLVEVNLAMRLRGVHQKNNGIDMRMEAA